MEGHRFRDFVPEQDKSKANFERLFDIFQQLILMTSGNVGEAMSALTSLDKRFGLTDESYGIGDFYEDLKRKGYITETNEEGEGEARLSAKMEINLRQNALEEIFGKLKRHKAGNHTTRQTGRGDEMNTDIRQYAFGDELDSIAYTESFRNAQINHGTDEFMLLEEDLEIREREFKAQTSTVLMIDISHSMILYGEDRITPAKKVAMALGELITTRYPKDTLDIIVFGNDAWQIQMKDLPYLEVGPYHTNTIAGLELAMDILRRRKNQNKQIFMITDGKPTCMKVGINYYKNSFGLDRKILRKTLTLAQQCRKIKIPITTFMIASDPYLQEFVREFTRINQGKAYYSNLNELGNFIFEDFQKNRRKQV
ncbi:MAG: VWA domain-containing protein [Bacteroidetes bacterium]|nr:MAG: VWA domain-containing protein [Bacteroidota bacterium]